MRHVNHNVSKAIVAEALEQGASTMAMEELTHIRKRIKAGKRIRSRLHRWAWRQLQILVEYKAQASGIQIIYVNPAYSSKTCSVCGCLGARVKHQFSCSCGHVAHADWNASQNLAALVESIGTARPEVTSAHVAAAIR
jgi:IS605 OrfB family transposase